MTIENNNDTKFTIVRTDDNHRIFDIKLVPVSIPAIEEELSYIGRVIAGTTDSSFDHEGYINTNNVECGEWHDDCKNTLLIVYLDEKQVQTVEYNLDETSEELQRYAIVYGIVAHELESFDEATILALSKEFQLNIYVNYNEIVPSDICIAKDILIRNKVRELLVPLEVYTQYQIHNPNATPSEIAAYFKVPEFLLNGL